MCALIIWSRGWYCLRSRASVAGVNGQSPNALVRIHGERTIGRLRRQSGTRIPYSERYQNPEVSEFRRPAKIGTYDDAVSTFSLGRPYATREGYGRISDCAMRN